MTAKLYANDQQAMADLHLKGWRYVQVSTSDKDRYLIIKKHKTKKQAQLSKTRSHEHDRVVMETWALSRVLGG
jgi:hypothetical protein